MTRAVLVFFALLALAATAAASPKKVFPTRIDLPNGFQPEGISISGQQFYVGSIPTGNVYRGSLRTGKGAVLVQAAPGSAAVGLKVDRGRLFVAGGPLGKAFVYDARSGAALATYTLSSGGSFINDVVVTRSAAWFTDSFKPVLYRLPLGPNGRPGAQASVQAVPLTGDYQHQTGANVFNANGIAATPNGSTLVIVQSVTGKLFTVAPSGLTREIVLAGGANVANGDGILLRGKTLYVVQNFSNQVAKIALSPNLASGRVLARIGNAGFDVPTTIAAHGKRLYAVNARFSTSPTATTPYWITQLAK
jgi:sugar lactone lactonase YvrE